MSNNTFQKSCQSNFGQSKMSDRPDDKVTNFLLSMGDDELDDLKLQAVNGGVGFSLVEKFGGTDDYSLQILEFQLRAG